MRFNLQHILSRFLVVLLLTVVILSCESSKNDKDNGPKSIVTDYDPSIDGLNFENFAGFVQTAVVDVEAAHRLMGDAICLSITDGQCVPTPQAQTWINNMNSATRGGLCEGFSALSHLAWQGKADLSAFNVKSAGELDRTKQPEVDKEIAYWFTTQYAQPVLDETRLVTANELISALYKALSKGKSGETYRIGILQMGDNGTVGGGHALTPYGIEKLDDNNWDVIVYDSNFPEKRRAIKVDLNKDTWAYTASRNPDEAGSLYEGGPGNRNPLYLTPNSARLGTQPCHFCDDANGVQQSVSFSGALDVELKDSEGNRAGESENGLSSDIEGVEVFPIFTNLWLDDALYEFRSNKQGSFVITATANADGTNADDQIEISSLTKDGTVTVRGHGQGGEHVLELNEDGPANYHTDTANSGPLVVSVATEDGEYVTATVSVDTSQSGAGVSMSVEIEEETGEIAVQVSAEVPTDVRLEVDIVGTDEQNNSVILIEEMPSGEARVDLEEIQEGGTVAVVLDEGADGTADVVEEIEICDSPDACPHFDGDGDIVPYEEDNCPEGYNPDQADQDADGIGDVCDSDRDGDGTPSTEDCNDSNPDIVDSCRCAAGYSDHDNDENTPCEACSSGEYCPGGTAAPVQCLPGTWDDDDSPATACVACSEGEYCAGGSASAKPCIAGSYDHDNTPDTECETCSAGEYCAGGVSVPIVCSAGSWDDDESAATPCVSCSAGEYCAGGVETPVSCAAGTYDHDNSADTACAACAVGEFCTGGTAAPTACLPGTWDDDSSAATACVSCSAGEYCAGGVETPVTCAAGTYDDDNSADTACAACAVGEFCTGGTATPTACLLGTWDDDSSAATACVSCSAGEYCAGGVESPVSCAAGTYDHDSSAATACAACTDGEYCAGGTAAPAVCQPGTRDDDGSAATVCVACSTGEYCPGGGEDGETCAAGSYDDDSSPTTACVACNAGEYCEGGTAMPIACQPGTFDDDASATTVCVSCSSGEYCAGGVSAPVACSPGSWDDDDSAATVCVSCVIGEYCAGGTSSPEPCAVGTYDDDEAPDTVCVECTPGDYCPGGSAKPSSCLPGTWDDDSSVVTPCVLCSAGEYCAGGELSPEACAAGTYDDDSSPATPCAVCAAGEYCAGGIELPAVCLSGTWDDDSSATTPCISCSEGEYCAGGDASIVPCAAGTYDHDSAPDTVCMECVSGEYCAGGVVAPISCALGTWDDDDAAATPCVTCSTGVYCAGGDASAIPCVAGTYDHDYSSETACMSCIAGMYCAGGQERPATCQSGTWDDDDSAATACVTCSPGEYCGGGADNPIPCGAGTYDHDLSPSTACETCAAGEYCIGGTATPVACAAGTWDDDASAATECTSCSPGEYCAGGAAALQACAAGTWDDDASAATECTSCSPGEYCSGGTVSPVPCAIGTYDDDSSAATECVSCPPAAHCSGYTALPQFCSPGTYFVDDYPDLSCGLCNPGEYCPGGAAPREPCAPGTFDDDFDTTTVCVPCSPGEYCPEGTAWPVICEDEYGFDDDGDPSTPCVPRLIGSHIFGEGFSGLDGQPFQTAAQDVEYDIDGNIYVLATWTEDMAIDGQLLDGMGANGAVIKLNDQLETQWISHFANGANFLTDMIVTDGVYLSGGLWEASVDPYRVDTYTYPGPVLESCAAPACDIPAGEGAVVLKLDLATGAPVWTQKFGTTNAIRMVSLDSDGSGDIVALGWIWDGSTVDVGSSSYVRVGNRDGFVVRLSMADGSVQGSFQLNTAAGDHLCNAVAVMNNGDYVVVGTVAGASEIRDVSFSHFGEGDGYYVRTAPDGTLVSSGSMAATANEEWLQKVQPASDGGFYMVGWFEYGTILGGTTYTLPAGNSSVFAAKIDSENGIEWISVGEGFAMNHEVPWNDQPHSLDVFQDVGGEVVMVPLLMRSGDTIGGAAIPDPKDGEYESRIQLAMLDGDTGQTISFQTFHTTTAQTLYQLSSAAFDPVSGIVAAVGWFHNGSVTMDGVVFETLNTQDQYLLQLNW